MATFRAAVADPTPWPSEAPKFDDVKQQELAEGLFAVMRCSRPPSEWPLHDLLLLAELARVSVLCDEWLSALAAEGPVLPAGKNVTARIQNPLVGSFSTLSGRRGKLVTTLGLGGKIDSHVAAGRARTLNATRELLAGMPDDGLLAR